MKNIIDRRHFLTGLAAAPFAARPAFGQNSSGYSGPNVILVRFGGGVRRRETIELDTSYAPFLNHVMRPQGTLFNNMEIASAEGIQTSHAQGTLYLLTGRYDTYTDIKQEFLKERFEPKVPTLFEYLRKTYDVPAHQALIVNGEDRASEDFLTFSIDDHFGVAYRSNVLSLHQLKLHVLMQKLADGNLTENALAGAQAQLAEYKAQDYRGMIGADTDARLSKFWDQWQRYYGQSGLVHPRGDRLLTELAVRALQQLRPKLLLVNYQDPDYVHWGNHTHYTRAISIIDRGIRELVATVQADEEYRDNTVFVIVPDCGRDDNRLMSVPYQHHFGSKSAHEIWALLAGPGIARGDVVDRKVDQIDIAATIGQIMDFKTSHAEGQVLHQAFA